MKAEQVVRERSPSEAVLEAVAEREGVDPVDLDVPLFEAIDPEALDALLRTDGGRSPFRIRFTYYGYEVTATSDGSVHLSQVD